jgi:hypothetical protein
MIVTPTFKKDGKYVTSGINVHSILYSGNKVLRLMLQDLYYVVMKRTTVI